MQSVLNVRIDSALKERGDKVLAENGISVSNAVRSLWEELAKTREVPSFIKNLVKLRCANKSARMLLISFVLFAKQKRVKLISHH